MKPRLPAETESKKDDPQQEPSSHPSHTPQVPQHSGDLSEMPKAFSAKEVEEKWSSEWVNKGYFCPYFSQVDTTLSEQAQPAPFVDLVQYPFTSPSDADLALPPRFSI